eukprot:9469801-Pyramimonas_sp.AAC.1
MSKDAPRCSSPKEKCTRPSDAKPLLTARGCPWHCPSSRKENATLRPMATDSIGRMRMTGMRARRMRVRIPRHRWGAILWGAYGATNEELDIVNSTA